MTTATTLLGIEIGGTKLQLGLGRGDGSVLAVQRRTIVRDDGSAGVLAQILEAYAALIDEAKVAPGSIPAAGIGFGGPVDAKRGIATTSHHLAGWDAFPLADWTRRQLGIARVAVENDADTAGLAEARFGAGVGYSPVLYLTIGSGIGGGLILNGKIYRGAGAGAVEIGHLWVVDRNDSDLGVITLEDVASGWAIARSAQAYARRVAGEGRADWVVLREAGGLPEAITTEHVARAALAGDRQSRWLIEKAVHAMANGLGQAVTLLAPRRIILGGGVSLIGEDLWLGPIRRQLDACVFPPFRGTFDLVGAKLGEGVVIQGALALALDCLSAPV